LIKFVDSHLPDSVYRSLLKPFAEGLKKLSLCHFLNDLVDNNVGRSPGPLWTSEVYSLITFGFGIVSLLLLNLLPLKLAMIFAIFAQYFTIEIFIFALNWSFTDQGPVRSGKRSLAGFLLNFFTVIILWSTAYRWNECIRPSQDELLALYSSLRTAVTIGPVDGHHVPSLYCVGLIVAEIVVAWFLVITVIAFLVGSLQRTR